MVIYFKTLSSSRNGACGHALQECKAHWIPSKPHAGMAAHKYNTKPLPISMQFGHYVLGVAAHVL
jgi:hypothetical protein